MNKRVNQILEYICSIQVELATETRKSKRRRKEEEEDKKRHQLLDAQIKKATMEMDKENLRPTPILIPDKDFNNTPCSSLSSASTIPLNDDNEKSIAQEAIEKREQTSLEMMDILTRKVVTFQCQFGSFLNNDLKEAAATAVEQKEEEEDEDDYIIRPPVTRSSHYRSTTAW